MALPQISEAAIVGPRKAAAIASGFFGSGNRQMLRASTSAAQEADAPYYVFNRGEGNGFVIVSGNDAMGTVLGYSNTGTFSKEEAPEGLRALLELYARSISALDADAPAATSADAAGTPVVSPLLSDIHWGQGAPFNTLCPTYTEGGTAVNYYTGCVATAATQIMRFYKYPERGSGSHSYTSNGTTLTADFSKSVYDWANMPGTAPSVPTSAQTKALSQLAADFGIAVEMVYEKSGSGAYTMLVPTALKDYFGYDKALRMHSRSYYTTSQWMKMIKDELNAGRPVYYAASSEDGLGGHAFVCDGYDTNDFVHINWGWYGSSDGYFSINRLNPGELGTGGGSGAYNIAQEIITDFVPAGQSTAAEVWPVYGASRFTVSHYGTDMTVMTIAENYDTRTFDGQLGVVLSRDGEIAAVVSQQAMSIPGFAKGHTGTNMLTLRNVPVSVPGVADGSYKLNLAFRTVDSQPWSIMRHPMGLPAFGNAVVKNGVITSAVTGSPTPAVELTKQISVDGDIYAGGYGVFTVALKNLSSDVRISQLGLRFTSVDNPARQYVSKASVNVYDESEAELSLLMTLDAEMPAGDYDVTAFNCAYEDLKFDDSRVGCARLTVLPKADRPVVRTTSDIVARATLETDPLRIGENMFVAMSLRNYGADGNVSVIMRMVDTANPEHNYVFMQRNQENCTAGSEFTLSFGRKLPVPPGQYRLLLTTPDADGTETPLQNVPETIVTVEDNPAMLLEVTDFEFPTSIDRTKSWPLKVTVMPKSSYNGTLYIRLRQFTATNGEIVTMKRVTWVAGVPQTITLNYKPTVEDGRYMFILEANTSGNALIGGMDKYYREVTVSADAGVDDITVAEPAITVTGSNLSAPGAMDIRLYTPAGVEVASVNGDRLSLDQLPRGLYIARVRTGNAVRTAKILR